MKVNINGVEYKVWWHYFKNGKPLVLGARVQHSSILDTTACVIERTYASGSSVYNYSMIHKHNKDIPNRNLARKIGLKLVLKKMEFTREERTLFWKSYLEMTANKSIGGHIHQAYISQNQIPE